jgi:hypothetical protein
MAIQPSYFMRPIIKNLSVASQRKHARIARTITFLSIQTQ